MADGPDPSGIFVLTLTTTSPSADGGSRRLIARQRRSFHRDDGVRRTGCGLFPVRDRVWGDLDPELQARRTEVPTLGRTAQWALSRPRGRRRAKCHNGITIDRAGLRDACR